MLSKRDYRVIVLPSRAAAALCEKYHYLHSAPASIKFAFGLVHNRSNELVGFITYGIPHSVSLREGVAGKTYKNAVLELSRLWVSDDTPKNGESFLIGQTLRLLKGSKFKFIVSFADSKQGHVGTVYQATNWIYTGLTRLGNRKVPLTSTGHPLASIYGKTVEALEKEYGELSVVLTGGLHRYIHVNGDPALTLKIRFPQKRYP